MRPDAIRAPLRKKPFRPIRVYLSDGSSYDVRHPEMMLVTRIDVVIALDSGDDEIPRRSVFCDPIHITRIEPIDRAKRKRSPNAVGAGRVFRLVRDVLVSDGDDVKVCSDGVDEVPMTKVVAGEDSDTQGHGDAPRKGQTSKRPNVKTSGMFDRFDVLTFRRLSA